MIINEPNMFIATKKWFIEMADYIKSIDPHHLIGVATVDVLGPSGTCPPIGIS
jgi:endo-1,4-beta-mannosidase